MADCCGRVAEPTEAPCPACGRTGREVGLITLKALLRSEALARLDAGSYRFCATPKCPVVYFRGDDVFRREDVGTPVFQKEPGGGRVVCYCLGIGEDEIRQEAAVLGRPTAADRIKALVQSTRCACDVRNPQGSCCLGNVMELVAGAHPGLEGFPGIAAGS